MAAFARMVRDLRGDKLTPRTDAVRYQGMLAHHVFAYGLQRDHDALVAGPTPPTARTWAKRGRSSASARGRPQRRFFIAAPTCYRSGGRAHLGTRPPNSGP